MVNDDVTAMCKAGLSVEVVANAIRSAKERQFQLDPESLIKLVQAGVPSSVISEMQRASAPRETLPSLADSRSAFLINAAVGPSWIGTNDRFRELQTELRRWKRFEIVDDPRLADVTITLGTASSGEIVGGVAGGTFAASDYPVYTLAIRQRATGLVLWTSSEQTRALRFSQKGTLTTLLKRMQQEVSPLAERFRD